MARAWIIRRLNNRYLLRAGKKNFFCTLGDIGVKTAFNKIEGDKATPMGKWKLHSFYFRKDKVLRSEFKNNIFLKLNQITKNCGWCDDVFSNYYNKYIKINNFLSQNIHYEKLWREDNAYDIIVVISHNTKPTIKNKGSAVFLHCSFADNRNTSGCIALKKRDLIFLLRNLKNNTYIKIES